MFHSFSQLLQASAFHDCAPQSPQEHRQQGWCICLHSTCSASSNCWARSLFHLPLVWLIASVCFEMHGFSGRTKSMLQYYGNSTKSLFKSRFCGKKKKKKRRVLLTKQNPLRYILFAKQCTQKNLINFKLHSYILNSLKLFISILKIYPSTVASVINF